MYCKTIYESPVGELTLASDGDFLVGAWIENQKYFGATVPEKLTEKANLPLFDSVRLWLDQYFAGEKPEISRLPMAPAGGRFRLTVWEILCEIPYGETTIYGEIAKKAAQRLGKPCMSAQAVGGAVGHNPISIMIPCHRVVGSNGSLTGYAGGIQTKAWLLSHEGVDMSRLKVPTKGTAM